MDETKPPGIGIAQIYLARSFFEHAVNPAEFSPTTPVGELLTAIAVQAGLDEAGNKGFVSVSVSTDPASTGLYRFHVEMVAIVEQTGSANMSVREYLRGAGPSTLYPFIRETIATITGKGRFGPVWLPPMNFSDVAQNMKFLDEQEGEKQSPTS